jgi:hypothetical protein
MSINIKTETGLKILADKTTKATIEAALGYLPAQKSELEDKYLSKSEASYNYLLKGEAAAQYLLKGDAQSIYATLNDLSNYLAKEEDGDSFSISDSAGHIILTVDKDGVHSVDFYVKDKSILEIIEEADTNLSTQIKNIDSGKSDVNHSHNDLVSDSNEFAITDNSGNMIMKVDQAGVHSTAFYVDGKSISEIGFSGNYDDLTNKPDFNGLSSTVNSLSESVNSVIDEIDILDDSINSLKEADTNLSTQIKNIDSGKSDVNHSHDNLTSDSADFSITDNDGNIVATINQDGLNTVNLMLDGVDFSTRIDSKFETVLGDLRNEFNENDRLKLSLIPFGLDIPENADLNTTDYLSVGSYFCSKNVVIDTFTNCPTTQAFLMQVYSPISKSIDNEATGAWVYRLRKLMSYQGDEYIQYCQVGATAGT